MSGSHADGTSGSSLRRIDTARELRELADGLGVRPDWHEPDEQGLTARVEGKDFDNAGFWPSDMVSASIWPGELCVIISKEGQDIAAVNLASLLAMASYPDGPLR